MEVSFEGFKSTIGRKRTSDFAYPSPEKAYCIKPDQLGLGCSASQANHPACQIKSELTSSGKVYGTCNWRIGWYMIEERAF